MFNFYSSFLLNQIPLGSRKKGKSVLLPSPQYTTPSTLTAREGGSSNRRSRGWGAPFPAKPSGTCCARPPGCTHRCGEGHRARLQNRASPLDHCDEYPILLLLFFLNDNFPNASEDVYHEEKTVCRALGHSSIVVHIRTPQD